MKVVEGVAICLHISYHGLCLVCVNSVTFDKTRPHFSRYVHLL